MKIVYRISEQDYMAAADLFVANQKPWYWRLLPHLMYWLGVFVVAAQTAYLVARPHHDTAVVVACYAIGVLAMCLGSPLHRYFRRSYRNDHRFKHDWTTEFSDEGVHVVTPFSDDRAKWNAFVRFLESDKVFILFIAESIWLIFPKHGFGPGEADQLRMLLQSNVVSPK
jgi:YcxB-like protein